MCEFYKYFMENYADNEGYVDNDIAELYEEKPYILQVIESFFDNDENCESLDDNEEIVMLSDILEN